MFFQYDVESVASGKNDLPYLPRQLNILPKIELHVHAEGGTLTATMVRKLSKKNNMPPPDEALFGPNDTLKYKTGDFLDFLRVYDEVTRFIITPDDIREVMYDYLKRCHEEGLIYVELTCSPDHIKQDRQQFGNETNETENKTASLEKFPQMTYPEFVDAIAKAIDQAKNDLGIESRILMVLLRHNGAKGCEKTLEDIIAYKHPYVVGINLAGDEVTFPAKDFQDLYQIAKENDLKLTAHAGEFTGAEYVREAIQHLQLDRIGHGVRSVEDPKLLQYLIENKIGLEICPSSNVELKVYENFAVHPFKTLFERGVKCSLNSDDPTFFGTTAGNEYEIAKNAWGLTNSDLIKITKDAIDMSFCEETLKEKLRAQVSLYEQTEKLRELVSVDESAHAIVMAYQKKPSQEKAKVLVDCLNQLAWLSESWGEGIARDFQAAVDNYVTTEKEHTAALRLPQEQDQACHNDNRMRLKC